MLGVNWGVRRNLHKFVESTESRFESIVLAISKSHWKFGLGTRRFEGMNMIEHFFLNKNTHFHVSQSNHKRSVN